LIGLGGPRMASKGVELWAGLEELAVMGFVEVAKRLRFFRRLERTVLGALDDVDLVLPIDYPGFNMRLARAAHGRRVPVLYYIAPQVWAWKPGRARKLATYADLLAVILPFEVEIFERAGARVSFVGHPLLDHTEPREDRSVFCERVGLDPERPILALFPGSRMQEISRHLELFVDVAGRLSEDRPDLQVAVAQASGIPRGALEVGRTSVVDDSRGLLRVAHAALVKSGTTTLEAAVAGVPFVTVYRTHPLTYWMARRLVKLDHIALANLVAGRRIVPEFLQGDATVDRLAGALRPLLDEHDSHRAQMLTGLGEVRQSLGTAGAASRVADLAAGLLEER
jgi:lipid-A-disaccharide synthase